jgi:hypothetical protein
MGMPDRGRNLDSMCRECSGCQSAGLQYRAPHLRFCRKSKFGAWLALHDTKAAGASANEIINYNQVNRSCACGQFCIAKDKAAGCKN